MISSSGVVRVDVDVEALAEELEARLGDGLADEDLHHRSDGRDGAERLERRRRRPAELDLRAGRESSSSIAVSASAMSSTLTWPM